MDVVPPHFAKLVRGGIFVCRMRLLARQTSYSSRCTSGSTRSNQPELSEEDLANAGRGYFLGLGTVVHRTGNGASALGFRTLVVSISSINPPNIL